MNITGLKFHHKRTNWKIEKIRLEIDELKHRLDKIRKKKIKENIRKKIIKKSYTLNNLNKKRLKLIKKWKIITQERKSKATVRR